MCARIYSESDMSDSESPQKLFMAGILLSNLKNGGKDLKGQIRVLSRHKKGRFGEWKEANHHRKRRSILFIRRNLPVAEKAAGRFYSLRKLGDFPSGK